MPLQPISENNAQAYKKSYVVPLKWRYVFWEKIENLSHYPAIIGRNAPGLHKFAGTITETPQGGFTNGGLAHAYNYVSSGAQFGAIAATFTAPGLPIGTTYDFVVFGDRSIMSYMHYVEIDWDDFKTKLSLLCPYNLNLIVAGMASSNQDFVSGSFFSKDYLTGKYFNGNSEDLTSSSGEPALKVVPTTWSGVNTKWDALAQWGVAKSGAFPTKSGGDGNDYGEGSIRIDSGIKGWAKDIDMNVTVYMVSNEDSSIQLENTDQSLADNAHGNNVGGLANSSNWIGATEFTGDSLTSNIGSLIGSGLNLVEIFNTNSTYTFPSVYMDTPTYDSFVIAGGGIVGESGVFPNNSSIWIDKIELSLDGNSMSVLQNTDFDSMPLLTEGERIFGYILNSSGDAQPSFSGWVVSKSRELSGGAECIKYECKCLQYYFNQLYSPSYYLYSPSTTNPNINKGIEEILKTMLVMSGITSGNINLPNIASPEIDWTYKDIRSTLDWAKGFFGKYVYYVDKNGVFNFKASDSGDFIKNYPIPTRGTTITTTNKVLSFNPLTDVSRSRSKVVLVGDFPLVEVHGSRWFNIPYYSNITDPSTVTATGMYRSEFGVYIVFIPSKPLVSGLISNPSEPYEFAVINNGFSDVRTDYGMVEVKPTYKLLSVAEFNTSNFKSFIFINKGIYYDVFQDINVFGKFSLTVFVSRKEIAYRYVVRDREPLTVSVNTGYPGGIAVIKRPEFKKWTSDTFSGDDTPLMQEYIGSLREFYKPLYGGKLKLDGIDKDAVLLGKVSVTNTNLPTKESENLYIHSIIYDVTNQKTTLDLTNKVYFGSPFFSKTDELTKNLSENKEITDKTSQLSLYEASRIPSGHGTDTTMYK